GLIQPRRVIEPQRAGSEFVRSGQTVRTGRYGAELEFLSRVQPRLPLQPGPGQRNDRPLVERLERGCVRGGALGPGNAVGEGRRGREQYTERQRRQRQLAP